MIKFLVFIQSVSHNTTGIDIIIAEEEHGLVANGGVRPVRKVAMDALVGAVVAVVVGGREGGLVEVLRSVGIVLGVVRVRPELSLPPGPPHGLQHLPLIDVPRHRHLLSIHVHLQAVHACNMRSTHINIQLKTFTASDRSSIISGWKDGVTNRDGLRRRRYRLRSKLAVDFGDGSPDPLLAAFTIHLHQKLHDLSIHIFSVSDTHSRTQERRTAAGELTDSASGNSDLLKHKPHMTNTNRMENQPPPLR